MFFLDIFKTKFENERLSKLITVPDSDEICSIIKLPILSVNFFLKLHLKYFALMQN